MSIFPTFSRHFFCQPYLTDQITPTHTHSPPPTTYKSLLLCSLAASPIAPLIPLGLLQQGCRSHRHPCPTIRRRFSLVATFGFTNALRLHPACPQLLRRRFSTTAVSSHLPSSLREGIHPPRDQLDEAFKPSAGSEDVSFAYYGHLHLRIHHACPQLLRRRFSTTAASSPSSSSLREGRRLLPTDPTCDPAIERTMILLILPLIF